MRIEAELVLNENSVPLRIMRLAVTRGGSVIFSWYK